MEIKEKIISATIEIIQEGYDISDITIRKIAKRADIGVGLINYHFQSKENLINITTRTFINSIIAGWKDVLTPPKSDSKVELLTNMFQASAEFLATYPKISRISILNDYTNPNLHDNTMATLNGVLPILKSFDSVKAIEAGIDVIALIQWKFLRNDITKEIVGFDFFNTDQRNNFVKDICIEKFSKFENNNGDTI